ncbi:MAG: hypothetical protein WBA66_07445 [Xanthobacteraceae bacterium]|jgi:hypothetical protein
MSATVHPPPRPRDELDGCVGAATPDAVEQMRVENERLRELVVQLSRLVMQNAIARK